jgi:hypothetical protein
MLSEVLDLSLELLRKQTKQFDLECLVRGLQRVSKEVPGYGLFGRWCLGNTNTGALKF